MTPQQGQSGVRMVVDEGIIKRYEFSIEKAVRDNEQEIKDAQKLVIYPVELGNLIKVEKKDGTALATFRLAECQAEKVSEAKGRFRKADDLWLAITPLQQNEKRILANVRDRDMDEILDLVSHLKGIEKGYWETAEVVYHDKGQLATTKVPYKSPALAEGEILLWSQVKTSGIIHKQAVSVAAFTNLRAFNYHFDSHSTDGRILLGNVDDVIVTNQQSTAESGNSGFYTGGGHGGGAATGIYSGNSTGSSQTIGDIVFMVAGAPAITFGPVVDPHGLAGMASAAVKDVKGAFAELKKQAEEEAGSPEAQEKDPAPGRPATAAIGETITVVCPACKSTISKGANFCNNCGAKLQFICSKCGKDNPENSRFCNNCGFALN